MGFYDDLKKPLNQAKTQQKSFVISREERQILINTICYSIKNECEMAKKKGKNFYKSCYFCYVEEGATESCDYFRNVKWHCNDIVPLGINLLSSPYAKVYRCSQSERDTMLPLIQKALSADGFPPGTVQAYDYLHGAKGMGIFKHGGEVFYTFKIDVRW